MEWDSLGVNDHCHLTECQVEFNEQSSGHRHTCTGHTSQAGTCKILIHLIFWTDPELWYNLSQHKGKGEQHIKMRQCSKWFQHKDSASQPKSLLKNLNHLELQNPASKPALPFCVDPTELAVDVPSYTGHHLYKRHSLPFTCYINPQVFLCFKQNLLVSLSAFVSDSQGPFCLHFML